MCFSAGASFVASAVLVTTGIVCIKKTKRRSDRFFVAIPLLFALQQFIEGLQWLVVRPSSCSIFLGYSFLFFAFLVWPIFFPVAIYTMETNPWNKQILKWFVIVGVLGSIYMLIGLIILPLTITINMRSIVYNIGISYPYLSLFMYVFIVFGSAALSSHKFVRLFGLVLFVSAFISAYSFQITFTSVWCFFAAIASPLIYLHVKIKQKTA